MKSKPKPNTVVTCNYCGLIREKYIPPSQSNTAHRFCNAQCQASFLKDKLIQKWLDGEITGLIGEIKLQVSIRSYLIEQADYKCVQCGWGELNPVTGKSPLEIDHIDGDFRNNKPQNLRVLCPNCHSLTPTYKALNKGYGRGLKFSGIVQNTEKLAELV